MEEAKISVAFLLKVQESQILPQLNNNSFIIFVCQHS